MTVRKAVNKGQHSLAAGKSLRTASQRVRIGSLASALLVAVLSGCAGSPQIAEHATARILYSLAMDFDPQSAQQSFLIKLDIPKVSESYEQITFFPESQLSLSHLHNKQNVTLYTWDVAPGCFGGIATLWFSDVSDQENLNSTLSFYNFPNTCITAGELMYVGSYEIEAGTALSASGFVEVKAVEMSVNNSAATDVAEAVKVLPLEASEVVVAVPIDLTQQQQNAIEEYVRKLKRGPNGDRK